MSQRWLVGPQRPPIRNKIWLQPPYYMREQWDGHSHSNGTYCEYAGTSHFPIRHQVPRLDCESQSETLHPWPSTTPGVVIKRGDIAMYKAKAADRNNICFFAPEN